MRAGRRALRVARTVKIFATDTQSVPKLQHQTFSDFDLKRRRSQHRSQKRKRTRKAIPQPVRQRRLCQKNKQKQTTPPRKSVSRFLLQPPPPSQSLAKCVTHARQDYQIIEVERRNAHRSCVTGMSESPMEHPNSPSRQKTRDQSDEPCTHHLLRDTWCLTLCKPLLHLNTSISPASSRMLLGAIDPRRLERFRRYNVVCSSATSTNHGTGGSRKHKRDIKLAQLTSPSLQIRGE